MSTEHEHVPVDDTTRPCAEVVNFVREYNTRRLRSLNDADLERALRILRPEDVA